MAQKNLGDMENKSQKKVHAYWSEKSLRSLETFSTNFNDPSIWQLMNITS